MLSFVPGPPLPSGRLPRPFFPPWMFSGFPFLSTLHQGLFFLDRGACFSIIWPILPFLFRGVFPFWSFTSFCRSTCPPLLSCTPVCNPGTLGFPPVVHLFTRRLYPPSFFSPQYLSPLRLWSWFSPEKPSSALLKNLRRSTLDSTRFVAFPLSFSSSYPPPQQLMLCIFSSPFPTLETFFP